MTERVALRALAARAEELAKNDQFSGAVLVARRGKVLLQKVWGFANREARTPITLDTQFRLGSMNKMFTATGTLQLIEAGKLALDDPIGKHLVDYPNKDVSSKVTVRHLLAHSGGTGDIFGPDFTKNRLRLREHNDYVKLYGSRALVHEAGAEHRYSNYGYILLGTLIEKVSGMSYYDYVRSKVFQPVWHEVYRRRCPKRRKWRTVPSGIRGENAAWMSNADTSPLEGHSSWWRLLHGRRSLPVRPSTGIGEAHIEDDAR